MRTVWSILSYRRYYGPAHTAGAALLCAAAFYLQFSSRAELTVETPLRVGHTFTAMLAHRTPFHLWSNLLPLVVLGWFVESLHGPVRAAALFWIGGSFGALAHAGRAAPGSTFAGCSPAVYAYMGAMAAHLIVNWTEVAARYAWLVAIALTVAAEVAAATLGWSPTVSYTSHAAGLVMGTVLGAAVLKNPVQVSWERALREVCLALAGLGYGLVLLWVL